jgi:hypothetical protein
MKPGDLVRIRDHKWSGSGDPVLCLIVEVISDAKICIVLCRDKQWTAFVNQLELVDETG